jgi:hypothetical protein
MADGGMIAKGAVVESKNVAVDKKVNPNDINEFISYCNNFYGKSGIYAKQLNGGFSVTEIKKAILQYMDKLGEQKTWGDGDSLDRERVREILEEHSGYMAKGGEVVDLKNVYNDLQYKVGRMEINEETKDYINCYIRDWGNWEHDYEDYERDEEDFEDDDAMILSNESYNRMKKIVDEVRAKYTDVKINWGTSEKNYIDFQISRKMAKGGKVKDPHPDYPDFVSMQYKKGGVLEYYNKENEYKIGRPNGYIEKDILSRVNFSEEDFVGSFGWKTENKKLADGYLYKLSDFDKELVENIKLKSGDKIFRYFNRRSAIGGMKPLIKINVDKELLYFLKDNDNDIIEFETRGIQALWIALIEHKL